MNKVFRVSISDRKRDRIIRTAATAADAVRAAIGQRMLTCRLDSQDMAGTYFAFEAAVATGPTRHGSTPFVNVRAYVSAE